MDFGIESATSFGPIAYYGRIWLVEFRDWGKALVIEDPYDHPNENYVLTEDENEPA